MSAASKGSLEVGVEAMAPQFDTCCPHCNTTFRLGRDAPLIKVDIQTLLAERAAEQAKKKDDEFQAFVVNKLLDKDFQVPLLPHVAVKVMRLTSDHHSSMQDMARVIMTDQGIASKILQIANSPVYAGNEPVKTVSQALVRIGQTEIRNIMLSIALQGKVFKSKGYTELAKGLWEHSVAVAFASRVVANALRMPKEEAFLSGLMHELGKMVLLNIIEKAERQFNVDYHANRQLVDKILNRYHGNVGEMVAEKWEQMPEELLRILVMHSYTVDIAAADRMIAVVMVADDIVERRGIGPGEPKEIELSEGPGAKSLGLSADACAELDRRFAKAYDQAQGIFV